MLYIRIYYILTIIVSATRAEAQPEGEQMLRASKIAASALGTLAVIIPPMIAAAPASASTAERTAQAVSVKRAGSFVAHDGNVYSVAYVGTFGSGKFGWELGRSSTGRYAIRVKVLQGDVAKIIIADYPQGGGVVIATEKTGMTNNMVASNSTRVFDVTVRRNGNSWGTTVGVPQ